MSKCHDVIEIQNAYVLDLSIVDWHLYWVGGVNKGIKVKQESLRLNTHVSDLKIV